MPGIVFKLFSQSRVMGIFPIGLTPKHEHHRLLLLPMSSVLVVGARGMLGSSLCPLLDASGHNLFRQSRGAGFDLQFDPTDLQAWRSVLIDRRPDVVVNLAAATDVDRCESNPQWAYDANVRPVLAFVKAARDVALCPYFVHISSDQVYDGVGPHAEDAARPCNVYALSKLAADLAASEHPSAILRTNFFGASRSLERHSFSDWIVSSLRAGLPITVFDDVLFSALHLDTVCAIIARVLDARTCGTFNVGSTNGISKAQFAFELAKRLGLSTATMRVGSVSALNTRARRPLDMRLDSSRFENAFGIPSPTMSEQINHTVEEYRAQ